MAPADARPRDDSLDTPRRSTRDVRLQGVENKGGRAVARACRRRQALDQGRYGAVRGGGRRRGCRRGAEGRALQPGAGRQLERGGLPGPVLRRAAGGHTQTGRAESLFQERDPRGRTRAAERLPSRRRAAGRQGAGISRRHRVRRPHRHRIHAVDESAGAHSLAQLGPHRPRRHLPVHRLRRLCRPQQGHFWDEAR